MSEKTEIKFGISKTLEYPFHIYFSSHKNAWMFNHIHALFVAYRILINALQIQLNQIQSKLNQIFVLISYLLFRL